MSGFPNNTKVYFLQACICLFSESYKVIDTFLRQKAHSPEKKLTCQTIRMSVIRNLLKAKTLELYKLIWDTKLRHNREIQM